MSVCCATRRELYTLFALSKYWDRALERVQLVDTSIGGTSVAARLQVFDLSKARCYNPNDERKIRAAIDACPGGASAFEELVRRIGYEHEAAEERASGVEGRMRRSSVY